MHQKTYENLKSVVDYHQAVADHYWSRAGGRPDPEQVEKEKVQLGDAPSSQSVLRGAEEDDPLEKMDEVKVVEALTPDEHPSAKAARLHDDVVSQLRELVVSHEGQGSGLETLRDELPKRNNAPIPSGRKQFPLTPTRTPRRVH